MALDEGLPSDPYDGTGYDWIEKVQPPWYVVAADDDGNDLGTWPYIVIAVRKPGLAFACYVEGDVAIRQFNTTAELRTALQEYQCNGQ